MTSEDDFQSRLDAEPDNHVVRLVFADWLEERGDARAEGYRAMGAAPLNAVRVDSGAYFCRKGSPITSLSVMRTYAKCLLESDWFDAIEQGIEVRTGMNYGIRWWQFLSRREAEDAAALAFAKLPAERRLELLSGSGKAVTA